jgi:DNA uptake protein ComE-like DNA-binding protein
MFSSSFKRLRIAITLPLVLALTACGATTPAPTSNAASASDPTGAKVNLNTATAEEFLAAVPGLGNRMLREFQEYRPYVSILQFRKEIGKYVAEAQVAEYERYVFVPIEANDSDAATLQQIPGLDATEAGALIAARPFASNDEFLTKLAAYITADEAAIAQTYLSVR